jgi:hypothetical protein
MSGGSKKKSFDIFVSYPLKAGALPLQKIKRVSKIEHRRGTECDRI